MTGRALFTVLSVLAAGCAREPEARYPALLGDGSPPFAFRAQEARPLAPPEVALPLAGSPLPSPPPAPSPGTPAPNASADPPPAPAPPPRPPASAPPPRPPAPAPPAASTWSSATIPDGSACLELLGRLGVVYTSLEKKTGVATPVAVRGPVGGVTYRVFGSDELVADCRLVVALSRIAPILREEGVTEARFSGAYSYRMSRVGRLSLHAYGLAIDLHELRVDGVWRVVARDFARGLSDGCADGAPSLNRVACRLKATGLFREVLTPDSNADHQDHLHLGILPTGTTLVMLPRAPKRKSSPGSKEEQQPAAGHHLAGAREAGRRSRPLLEEEQAGIQLIEEPSPAPRVESKQSARAERRAPAKRKRRVKSARSKRRRPPVSAAKR
ncbi:MAG: extensin family protein [Sorangiineae bacterium]|nr:extensin family protein [Polyangiaceae bacterium]MEB2323667.1 extensin family protein [Sorangiineae bacterium]